MASSPGKQHIDLIRHRELNALRILMAQRSSTPLLQQILAPTFGATQLSPHTGTLERIDALEAQMTTLPVSAVDTMAGLDASLSARQPQQPIQPKPEQTDIHLAAAYFANQQTDQAQHHLEQAIQPQGACRDHVSTWLSLLDLYRATGQAAAFDAVALDFSIRFGRSTPSWISIVDLAAQKQITSAPSFQINEQVIWTAPQRLNASAIESFAGLIAAQAGQGKSLIVDWRALEMIDAVMWPAVRQILNALAQTKLVCQILGAAHFAQLLNKDTEASALANLAWLRCQNAAEAFEEAALDYCSVFEVSPPDWIAPHCKLSINDDLLFLKEDVTVKQAAQGTQVTTISAELALIGEVIDKLPNAFSHYGPLQLTPLKEVWVSCERLVRCDRQATLALRLWASALHAQGTSVTFTQAHRLVAAYFLTEGIYAFAKVTARKD